MNSKVMRTDSLRMMNYITIKLHLIYLEESESDNFRETKNLLGPFAF